MTLNTGIPPTAGGSHGLPIETTEVRWFGEGAPPHDLVAWFESELPGAERQPERIDAYLALDSRDLSVKLRDDLLEAKGRRAESPCQPLAVGVHGRVETWSKWSVSASDAVRAIVTVAGRRRKSEAGAPHLAPAAWTLVRKSRRAAPLPALGARSVVGFVELTAVTVDDKPWWTLGAECTAGLEAGFAELREALASLVERGLPVRLDCAMSDSYAGWLLRRGTAGAAAPQTC